jgi:hypothetical protein
MALFWADLETGEISSTCGLPSSGRSFRCYAYGAACAISLNGSKLLSRVVCSITVEEDIVSCLSLGACRDVASASRWMNRNRDEIKYLTPEMFGDVVDTSLDKEFLAKRLLIEAQYMNSDAKLYPAGKVFFIDDEGIFHVTRVDVLYAHLYLSSTVEKHLPHSYEAKVNEL